MSFSGHDSHNCTMQLNSSTLLIVKRLFSKVNAQSHLIVLQQDPEVITTILNASLAIQLRTYQPKNLI